MPTRCEECGEYSYSIYFTREWDKLCPDCYKDKYRKKDEGMDAELAKYPYRITSGNIK